jgi:hypothetical protein
MSFRCLKRTHLLAAGALFLLALAAPRHAWAQG